MYLKEINHLAFITGDMEQTIRFYRDLLCMELTHGIGHDGYRHYFFKTGNNYIAFFSYDGAQPMEKSSAARRAQNHSASIISPSASHRKRICSR